MQQERLRRSYEKQVKNFETAKENKLWNIQRQVLLIEEKVKALNLQKQNLKNATEKTERMTFGQTFEEYVAQSKIQSMASKEISHDSLELIENLDPDTKELVLQGLRERGLIS